MLLGRVKAADDVGARLDLPGILVALWKGLPALMSAAALGVFLAGGVGAAELIGPQKNAVRSAEQYLNLQGYSKAGLIQQLSSQFGDGYRERDAKVAVESLGVDWKEQAARSAEQYLELQGYSCQGLIDQLSSSYGEQFTNEEARYGANQTDACY